MQSSGGGVLAQELERNAGGANRRRGAGRAARTDGTYSAGTCLPVQVEAVDYASNPLPTTADVPVTLAASVESSAATGNVYSDSACATAVTSVVVAKSTDGVSPSLTKVYAKAAGVGILRITASWANGVSSLRLHFK